MCNRLEVNLIKQPGSERSGRPAGVDGRAVETSDDGSHHASATGDGPTISIDITDHVDKKLAALALHRSQYPIDVNAFPHSMLEEMFGIEHFTTVLRG